MISTINPGIPVAGTPAHSGAPLRGNFLAAYNDINGMLPGTINVKQFGAKGDGIADDSAAIQAAMTYASTNQVEMYVPAGDYLLNSQIVVAVSTGLAENFFTIRGAGSNIAKFIVNNAVGGMEYTVTSRQIRIKITGLRFEARLAGSGTALKISFPEGGTAHFRNLIVDDVTIQPEDPTADYFNNGINATGLLRPLFTNIMISGIYTGAASADYSDNSPQFYMDTGLNVFGCYGVDLYYSTIWSCKTAVLAGSASNPGAEGYRLEHCALTNCQVGFDVSTPGTEPGGFITNLHINSTHYGIKVNGSKLITMKNVQLYNNDVASAATGTPIDIYIGKGSGCFIEGCSFGYPGNNRRQHIVIEATPVSTEPFSITGNLFESTTAAAILVNTSGVAIDWADNWGCQGPVYPTAAQYEFLPALGTATKNAGTINTDTITATDANIRALAAWVKGLANAVAAQNLTSPFNIGNQVVNSRGLGSVAGTPGVAAINWGMLGTGLTLTTVGSGIDANLGISYVDLRWSGTSANNNFSIGFASGIVIEALSGQTWTEEVWVALLATGTGLTNVGSLKLDMQSLNTTGVFIQDNAGADIKGSLTANLQRFTATAAIGGGSTVGRVNPILAGVHTISAPIDITLRVGWPQVYQ